MIKTKFWHAALCLGIFGALIPAGVCHGEQSASRIAFDYKTWDQYLGGSDSSQYSSIDQINRDNVANLELAWSYPTGERDAYFFNPLVVDKVMYVLAHDHALIALDAATGKEIWRHANEGRIGDRGMNYWESEDRSDRRLFYLISGMLTCVDAGTGETIKSFGKDGLVDLRAGLEGDISTIRPLQTNNPGRIFEDLIIMSLPAGGIGYLSSPADIHAYDVRSGKLVWIFHTVPRRGEFGADTWPEAALGQYGGVHNWSESTVDAERGIIYIPTGTARYDFYGANRHGQNLFGNSIVALNARTGERIWHFQTIHHDLWDFDLPQAPKLLTIKQRGKEIPAVVQATKQGFLFVFNRVTGEPVWPIKERPVPQSDVPGEQSWPTQPFPTKPPPFARQRFTKQDINPYLPEADKKKIREILKTHRNEGLFTPPSLQGTIMMPGHNGGANWGSAAVDPVNGRFYIVSKELSTTADLAPPKKWNEVQNLFRADSKTPPPNAGDEFVQYSVPIDFMLQSNGLPAVSPPWSQLTAYDLNKGTILWQVPNGSVWALQQYGIENTGAFVPRNGPVVTGGGLIFIATSSDRTFRARDADTGKVLWEYPLPAASEGIPAVYAVNGREYIALPVGGVGLMAQRLHAPEPGQGQYLVFALPDQ
jgi:quinoprotein glucose dehydrogenase